MLEEVVEADVVPELLTVAAVEGTGHLYRDDEVAVHHNLQATTCSSMQLLFVA